MSCDQQLTKHQCVCVNLGSTMPMLLQCTSDMNVYTTHKSDARTVLRIVIYDITVLIANVGVRPYLLENH